MKASELRNIIKEEVYNVKLKMLNENIVQDIMAIVLSSKAKKAVKTLKSDPDFIELQKEIEISAKSIEQINKRLERNLEKRQSITKDMQKSGIDVNMNMNADQIYNAFKTWQSKESKKVGKSEWEKYFK